MITPSGRETSRSSERPLVRTLRKSPHQANHGYLTRLLPGLFLPVKKPSLNTKHLASARNNQRVTQFGVRLHQYIQTEYGFEQIGLQYCLWTTQCTGAPRLQQ